MTGTLKKNLDMAIFEKLKEELITGNLHPGQQISIDEIAGKYGVSRTPVVHATKLMASEGIFTIRHNGRVEVPVFNEKQITDICRMRLLLEEFAAKCICRERNPDAIGEIRRCAEECERQTRVLNDMIGARKMDLIFHRQIVLSARNECLLSSYVKIQGQFTTANHLFVTHTDAAQVISCEEHTRIVESLAEFNYKAAGKVLEGHIMEGCKRILRHMKERKAQSASGT